MPEARVRQKIVQKLKAHALPRSLPSPPVGDLEGRETMQIGGAAGKRCSGCDEVIKGGDANLATQFSYGRSLITLHDLCFKIWDEERRRPQRRE